EDDPEARARARVEPAHPVTHPGAVYAPRTPHRTVAIREDHRLAALEGDHRADRLRARALLDEEELAAREVPVTLAEDTRDLERERQRTVQILVEAVVAALAVAEEERRRAALAVGGAAREVGRERRRITLGCTERRHPPVRERRQATVQLHAQRGDERRERRGEVPVLAFAEPVARHVDPAPEATLVVPQADERRALRGAQQRARRRMAGLVERLLD